MEIGILELKRQLEVLGYVPEIIDNRFVTFKMPILHGRFKGRAIDIALESPNFPINPPSGPFIKPHLMPITGGGGAHPTGGIHAMNKPTSEWQYWSRPFNNWNSSEKTASEYLAFLRTLFDFE
jgi:hypothetical protein